MIRIKQLREELGKSKAQVARELQIPYTTFVNYENEAREPNSEVLIMIANYFHVSVDYLIGRTENRHGNSLWLASLPTPTLQMRLGKYLAALTLLTIPTVFLMIYPPLLENYGTLSYGSAYTALLGYWLLNAALLAACSVIACCIKRVWVALLVGEVFSLYLLVLHSLVLI